MLQLNFDNLFKIFRNNPSLSVSKGLLMSRAYQFDDYRQLVKSRGQGFLDLPKDIYGLSRIKAFCRQVEGRYQEIVILAIGGSMLGPETLLKVLDKDCPFKNPKKPKITFLDNIDPYTTHQVIKRLNFGKTLFLVQTKSGGTPETLAQYLIFRQKVRELGLEHNQHFVFVTDPEGGYLNKVADQTKTPTFHLPKNVGGRFSVLSSIGLLVAGLTGVNLEELLRGASYTSQKYFEEGKDLTAFEMAVIHTQLAKKGMPNLVIMPYSSQLRSFSSWCVQLYSESLGKELDLEGKVVNTGLTPISALGATDQHSQLQLFKEGPNDKQILFIEVANHQQHLKIPSQTQINDPKVDYLLGHSLNRLLQAQLLGTQQSLTESKRANFTLKIDKINEFSLGSLFMFFELVVAFAGEIMAIDTFNQPGVERSKVVARQILDKAPKL